MGPLIDNPDFKGEWHAKKIENPAYKGYELWIVNNGTIFDNILVTDDIEYAKAQGEKLWRPTKEGEKEKWDKENKPADDLDSEDGGEDDDEGEGEGDGDDEEEKDEL